MRRSNLAGFMAGAAATAACIAPLTTAPAAEAESPAYGVLARGLVSPHTIARGPDGNMWFSDHGAGSLGAVTPTGQVATIQIGQRAPQGLATGADGLLWFADSVTNSIVKVTGDGLVDHFGAGIRSRWCRPRAFALPSASHWLLTGTCGSPTIWEHRSAG